MAHTSIRSGKTGAQHLIRPGPSIELDGISRDLSSIEPAVGVELVTKGLSRAGMFRSGTLCANTLPACVHTLLAKHVPAPQGIGSPIQLRVLNPDRRM